MALSFSTALRNARGQAIIDAIDAGGAAGTVKFYTGTKPTTPGAAITTEVLLGTLTHSYPCATVADAVTTFAAIADDLAADADGTIGWGRCEDSLGGFVFDGDAGIADSGAAFIFNTLEARLGGIVQILSMVIPEGNA